MTCTLSGLSTQFEKGCFFTSIAGAHFMPVYHLQRSVIDTSDSEKSRLT